MTLLLEKNNNLFADLHYSQVVHYPFLICSSVFTFGSLLSQIRLSVVCNVRAPYTQGAETFGNISSPRCTLAIL